MSSTSARSRQQIPLGSDLAGRPEPARVLRGIDLAGRTALVTGGYSGIGLETTRALAAAGARVVVPVRSPDKAAEALAGIPGEVDHGAMDLADLGSVRAFAEAFAAREPRLDLLVANAGVMACPETRVGPGWELQFATNHLGHFVLVDALLPLLRRTAERAERVRVVVLSSSGHRLSDIRWEDPHFTAEPYDKWLAYGQAKTANALFARGLDHRVADAGVSAYSVHPGGILTPLQRHLPREEMVALGWVDADGNLSERAAAHFKTPAQGAATTLWAATTPALDAVGGVFCEDCDVAREVPSDATTIHGVRAHAASDAGAERLWAMTEALLA
jgi:NAD(P)-dependent dehydrogenase (short-subunit alcohol dehydrogenase family)